MPANTDGKLYKINEKDVKLFPISILAQKLGKALKDSRTTQTIRKWEVKGVIPPAIFRNGQKRLYSMEQIDCICRVAKEENIRQGYSLSMTQFSLRVWEEMRIINRKYVVKD